MKIWQLILTFLISGGVFLYTVHGENLLLPTISWTICILSGYSIYGSIVYRDTK
jgi:hypothetical protein